VPARINECDGEHIEWEAAQACLFVFFLGLNAHVGQQHLEKFDGIGLAEASSVWIKRPALPKRRAFRQALHRRYCSIAERC
jgi:hypothetical protein